MAESTIPSKRIANCNLEARGINNGSSITISLPSTTRGLLFVSGAVVGARGIYGFGINSSGSVTTSTLINASSITLTTGTNQITISNSSGAYASAFVLWQ